jgi:hypothetical protein
MCTPGFGEVPGLWEPDSSLRDVYFLETNAEHWLRFFAFIQAYPVNYTFDGKPRAVPSVAEVFANRAGSHLLAVSVDAVTIHCHFFSESEIELDIEPREVKGPQEHQTVLAFVAQLSAALGRAALITPENGAEVPFLSFEPGRHAWSVCG